MRCLYLFTIILWSANLFAENVYTLSDAAQRKLIAVNLTGAERDSTFTGEYSSHYGPCMQLQLASNSSETMSLKLEYGYNLVPDDSSLQTMIVTQTLIVKLAPKQKKTYRVYAMCTQAHDGGPSPQSRFELRNRSTGYLLELTELLNRKKYQGNTAQNAMWCLTDDYGLNTIFSTDTAMMFELRRFVAKAKGISPDKIYAKYDDDTETEPVRTMRTSYSGSFTYSFSRAAKVTIALYNSNNQVVTTYLNNETQNPGEHTFNYKVDGATLNGNRHYVRMYRDGRLYDEVSIIPD
ncbi:MAG TPA: hypothetical protein PLW44_01100 [Chitinophagales bacterium]|nr:hypothetical protein [Chitinophagales bacterium]